MELTPTRRRRGDAGTFHHAPGTVLSFLDSSKPGNELMDRLRLLLAVVLAAHAPVIAPAAAQSWPTRPLTLVVPFAAGGPSDVAGRIIALRLGEVLGQQVIVENPSGAGGTLGSSRVAKAPPDGYQFVIGNIGTHAWSQSLYRKPPYNTVTDFVALSLVVESPRALITPKNFPANSLPEFIAYMKANQAAAKLGSAGAGSASHVSCILLNAALGVSVTHVPYRGLGPAMQDLIAGRLDYMCDSPSTSLQQIETNLIKAIATTGQRRAAAGRADGARAGPRFRGDLVAGPVPAEGNAGADRAPSHSGGRRDPGFALGARALREHRRGRHPAGASRPAIFGQVRRRRDRQVGRPDQGERRERRLSEPTGPQPGSRPLAL